MCVRLCVLAGSVQPFLLAHVGTACLNKLRLHTPTTHIRQHQVYAPNTCMAPDPADDRPRGFKDILENQGCPVDDAKLLFCGSRMPRLNLES